MGQLQDKIEEKIKDKIQYHLKSFDESIKTVRQLEKQKLWPFDTVSAKQFLEAVEPFAEAIKEARKAANVNFVSVATPALKDRIATTAIELTKCIHAMELETIVQDLAEFTYDTEEMSQKLNNMTAVLEWAQEELYKDNSYAVDLLQSVAQETDRTPILLAQEDSIDFSPWHAVFMTDFVIQNHEEAYKRVLDSSNELLRYGAPSETLVGKFIDKVADLETLKQQNAANAIDLANQEIDIEYLNTFVCHSLKRDLARTLALIAAEQENPEDNPVHSLKELKEKAQRDAFALRYVEENLNNMREREKAMAQGTTLSIKRVGDGTFAITISQPSGMQKENEITGKDSAYKETLQKEYFNNSRTIKVGKKSSVVKMDTHMKYGVFKGSKLEFDSSVPKKENEKVKSLKERIYGELSYTKIRSMKARGHKSVRSELKLNALRFKDKKIKVKEAKGKKKEIELLNKEFKVLSATISAKGLAEGSIGTPTISIGGNLAEAQLGSHGVNINASLGAKVQAGAQISAQDIAKSAAEMLAGELTGKDNDLDFKAVVEKLTEFLNNIPPEAKANLGNITISAKGINLLNVQVEEQTPEIEDSRELKLETSVPIRDEIQGLVEDVDQALNELEEIHGKLYPEQNQQQEQTASQLFPFDHSQEHENNSPEVITGGDISPKFDAICMEEQDCDLVL